MKNPCRWLVYFKRQRFGGFSSFTFYACIAIGVLLLTLNTIRLSRKPSAFESLVGKKPIFSSSNTNFSIKYRDKLSPYVKARNTNANNPAILTIFTSFKGSESRKQIHTNVLYNWAQYIPRITPILYDSNTDKSLVDLAKKLGWTVLPLLRAYNQDTPFLKEMYFGAREVTSSVFYGYSNGDILFDEGLVDTLTAVSKLLDTLNDTMVIGRRTNVNINNRKIYKSQDLIKVAEAEGELFLGDAEDYFFIAHNSFPWNLVPDVLIGRPGYDNYLVAMAIVKGVSVIDATTTLLAFHQTDNDGNFAGFYNQDSNYNLEKIGNFDYAFGSTMNAQYVTRYTSNHQVEVLRRQWLKSLLAKFNDTLTTIFY